MEVWLLLYSWTHKGIFANFEATLRNAQKWKNNKGIKTILVRRILKDTLHHTAKIMSDCCKKKKSKVNSKEGEQQEATRGAEATKKRNQHNLYSQDA